MMNAKELTESVIAANFTLDSYNLRPFEFRVLRSEVVELGNYLMMVLPEAERGKVKTYHIYVGGQTILWPCVNDMLNWWFDPFELDFTMSITNNRRTT